MGLVLGKSAVLPVSGSEDIVSYVRAGRCIMSLFAV